METSRAMVLGRSRSSKRDSLALYVSPGSSFSRNVYSIQRPSIAHALNQASRSQASVGPSKLVNIYFFLAAHAN
ncbi:unnamed protein product [Enterobius vermicularis]|uniref:Uncharacterized protein n=1 Tax=Enterobius vermicularis TaxID=51028 RepID=A0A0N4V1Z9_ENTVE|nr:unnamed protein product [Enterobius vermicularis]